MKLLDARRLAVREQAAIRFTLSTGSECVVDRHGIARIPDVARGSGGPTELRIEDEFGQAQQFTIQKEGAPPQRMTRPMLEEMAKQAAEPAHAASDHDD